MTKVAAAGGREVAVLSTVQHPHLVRLASVGDGTVSTVAVPGGSLADHLGGGGRLPWADVVALLAPVAEALAALHAAGWVHGDVSTGNILIGDRGGVLADLGSAHRHDEPGAATGTPGSVAPEVATGNPTSAASDVWSLAAVAREAAGGLPASLAIALGDN
ncbi:MAG: protein kinase domain-containing protein, partial [Acidimicrobiales bacterium]